MSEGLPYRVQGNDTGQLVYVCESCDAEIPDGVSVEWVKGPNGKHFGVRAYNAGAIGATPDFPDGRDDVVHNCSGVS